MPIDTLKASKRLRNLGFSTEQSEGLAELLSDTDAASATKKDIDEVRTDVETMGESIRADMNAMEESIRADMNAMEESIRADMNAMEESIRADMKKMEGRLRHYVLESENRLRSDLRGDIESVKRSLTNVVVASAAAVGTLLAIVIPLTLYLLQ